MPYKIRKLPNREEYRVYNSETKEIKAYGTTLEKAKRMIRLLYGVEHGWTPSSSSMNKKTKSSIKQK